MAQTNKLLSFSLAICLLPLWPVLGFIQQNRFEQALDIGWILVTFGTMTFLLVIIYLIGRLYSTKTYVFKTYVMLCFLLCFFQFYYDIKINLLNEEILTNFLLFSLFVSSLIVCLAGWKIGGSKTASSILGVYSLVVAVIPLVSILTNPGLVTFEYIKRPSGWSINSDNTSQAAASPNVYFFVFDAYIRSDILNQYFNYNNTEFVTRLTNKGFVVAKRSRSNFPTTKYSLNYVLNPNLPISNGSILPDVLHKSSGFLGYDTSEVANEFIQRDYGLVMMNSKGETRSGLPFEFISTYPPISYAQIQFLKNTPIYDLIKRFFPDVLWHWVSKVPNDNRYVLDKLPATVKREPLFLFSHALIPHPPYSVDRDCKPLTSGVVDFLLEFDHKDYANLRQHYLDQLECSNLQMIDIADRVITSDPSAIIFFVSDHGWKSTHAIGYPFTPQNRDSIAKTTRLSNFIAIRAPKRCLDYLNEDMTLVNSFPFIFSCLDDKKPEYIEDISYVVEGKEKKILKDVTATVVKDI